MFEVNIFDFDFFFELRLLVWESIALCVLVFVDLVFWFVGRRNLAPEARVNLRGRKFGVVMKNIDIAAVVICGHC